jgi:hypothetical protein
MKARLACFAALAATLAVLVGLTIAPAASAQTTPGLTVSCVTPTCLTQSITGTVGTNTFDLTSTLTRFVNVNGTLNAVTAVTGTVTNTVTGVVTPVSTTARIPVTALQANGTCSILDLTLGPLHLDLLGLVVDLNQVHLTITGQTGPGNLLGNLLCGLANALNGGQGGGIAGLLNRLFGL